MAQALKIPNGIRAWQPYDCQIRHLADVRWFFQQSEPNLIGCSNKEKQKFVFFLSGFSRNNCSEMKELNIGLLKNNLCEATCAYKVIVYLMWHLIY